MIAIVDYDCGNIRSVKNALQRLGADYTLTDDPAELRHAERLILPGVGSDDRAIDSLRRKGLVDVIKRIRRPVLGICVGMQVMCRDSEEGPCEGMGIFDAHVSRFKAEPGLKIPHMGWDTIANCESKLLRGLPPQSYVYFVHSYRANLCPDTIATCRYGKDMFSAALKYENFYGTQFHPEKSGDVGELILKNFLEL